MFHFSRFEFDGTFIEREGQQFVSGRGFAADSFAEVHRPEPHGFASVPIKGGIGTVLASRERRERAYILGGESPALRPKNLPAGAVALYDSTGNIIKLFGDGVEFDFGSRSATFTAGDWTVNGAFTVKGDLRVEGAIHATGNISTDSPDGDDE